MADSETRATVEGPITGGDHGWAFGRPLFDLADYGYVEEEYFLDGTATTFRQVAGTEWGRDGRWHAEANESMPYKTRILIYRPTDAERFNGTVIVSWNNVTAGYELFGGESPEILDGGCHGPARRRARLPRQPAGPRRVGPHPLWHAPHPDR